MNEPQEPVDALVELLERAELGVSEDLQILFSALLTQRWIIPRRDQTPPFKEPAAANGLLVDVTVVESDKELLVPIFSSQAALAAWTDRTLHTREATLSDLEKILPNEWWLAINPGSEVSKEVSPWEREMLAQGNDGIKAIIEELAYQPVQHNGLTLRELESGELKELLPTLLEWCKRTPQVERAYLARQELELSAQPLKDAVIVAVQIAAEADIASLRTELKDLLSPLLIGGPELALVVGDANNITIAALIEGFDPAYTSTQTPSAKPSGFKSRIASAWDIFGKK